MYMQNSMSSGNISKVEELVTETRNKIDELSQPIPDKADFET